VLLLRQRKGKEKETKIASIKKEKQGKNKRGEGQTPPY